MFSKYQQDLTVFYQATKIPFCVFDNTPQCIFRYPLLSDQKCSQKTLKQCVDRLSEYPPHQPFIFVFSSCMLAIIVLDDQTNVMFGPITSVPLTYHQFYDANSRIEDLDDLMHLYKIVQHSPLMDLAQFSSNISLFMRLAFQEDIPVSKMTFSGNEPQKNEPTNTPAPLSQKQDTSVHALSMTIAFQKSVLQNILNGNLPGIHEAFEHGITDLTNVFTTDTSEEFQRFFYSFALICCICVIESDMGLKDAFHIFKAHVSMLFSIHSVTDMIEMCQNLSLEYGNLILSKQNKKYDSSVVAKSLQYIHEHLQNKISVDDLAQYCNVSKRTVLRHFSEHFDMSAAEYIMEQKLKEGAFLLEHSSMTFAEISNQLAFSSQSHFSTAFKKRYHCTPQQYRNK